jgi:serine/threonine protein phosphatase 1
VRSSVSTPKNFSLHGRRPSLPPGTRIYAIGDVHGRVDLLDKMLTLIEADVQGHATLKHLYVFLGDYIDRGRWSRETINRLIKHGEVRESVFLKGNHELMALNCLSDRKLIDRWLRLGGIETLASYGVAADLFANGKQTAEIQLAFHNALPQTHFRFFRNLQGCFTCGDFFFVHAGVKPSAGLTHQRESDLLWIRDEFLSSNRDFGKIIVHGHSPTDRLDVRSNRINVDTGAFATGRLTCLVIEGETLHKIDTLDN